jgi:nucleoside-diphosphate-sugar epimerase
MTNKKNKILITGAAGKVGKELIKILLNDGHTVRVLIHKNFPKDIDSNNVEVINGDLNDPGSLDNALDNIDLVCHLAAVFDIFPPYKYEIDNNIVYKVNLEGTYNLMEAMRKSKKARYIIFGSSESVYDSDTKIRNKAIIEKEELFPARFYALTKIIGENLVKGYKYLFDIDFTILRLSWILDTTDVLRIYEYETWEDIVPEEDREYLSSKCSGGKALFLPVYEDNNPRVDHIIDGRDAALICSLCVNNDNAKNEIFNAAGPYPFNYGTEIKAISNKLGKDYYEGKIKNRVPYKISINKAKKILNYDPQYPMGRTIKEAMGNI